MKKKKLLRLKRFLIYLHGTENGKKRYIYLVRGHTKKMYMFLYGKLEGTEKYNKNIEKQKGKGSLIYYINKYGEKLGNIKYKEKNKKLSISVESLKNNGYNEQEIQFIRKQHSEKSSLTFKNAKRLYGNNAEREMERWKNNRVCIRKIDDWVNKKGKTKEEAEFLVKKYQSFGEEYYIEKYGNELGKEKFNIVNEKRRYANTLEYYIEKYGNELGKELFKRVGIERLKGTDYEYLRKKYGEYKANDILKKRTTFVKNRFSKIQIEFSRLLYDNLPEYIKHHFIGIPINYSKFINFNKNVFNIKCCVPDVIMKNIIVEFDGDYWHNLPDVEKRDREKEILLKELGFFIIRIQEYEFRRDKEFVIKNVIEQIVEKYEDKIN